jgi:hypothetical protein
MSELQNAIKQSIEEGDIDLMLPVLLESTLFMVCDKEMEDGEQDIMLTPSQDPGQLCITVAEDAGILAPIKTNNPDFVFVEIKGDELLGLVRDELEIMVLFDDGGYCISRDQIEWWYSEMHMDAEGSA